MSFSTLISVLVTVAFLGGMISGYALAVALRKTPRVAGKAPRNDKPCDWCKEVKPTVQTEIWSKASPAGKSIVSAKDAGSFALEVSTATKRCYYCRKKLTATNSYTPRHKRQQRVVCTGCPKNTLKPTPVGGLVGNRTEGLFRILARKSCA